MYITYLIFNTFIDAKVSVGDSLDALIFSSTLLVATRTLCSWDFRSPRLLKYHISRPVVFCYPNNTSLIVLWQRLDFKWCHTTSDLVHVFNEINNLQLTYLVDALYVIFGACLPWDAVFHTHILGFVSLDRLWVNMKKHIQIWDHLIIMYGERVYLCLVYMSSLMLKEF